MESTINFQEEEYIPISQRPEWADVTPLREGEDAVGDPVVHIAADAAHLDLLAYFWAGVAMGELSQRMVDLSEEIILEFNSAHYTVWEWRWRCVEALGGVQGTAATASAPARAAAEIALMRRVATDNPKNYQLWNYRRKFALARGPDHWPEESDFSSACLVHDAKNYHTWAHRQALSRAFGAAAPDLWAEELALTDRLLLQDARNNSAWNHRLFVLLNAPQQALLGRGYEHEFEFAIAKLQEIPHNEAAWEYIRGITKLRDAPLFALTEERVINSCCAALEEDRSNVPALLLLADSYAASVCVLHAGKDASQSDNSKSMSEALHEAIHMATKLFERLEIADPIRAAYYRSRRAEILSPDLSK